MAAIATLDAAVVESGGEVITLADRQAAITELDAAVEERERSERESRVRLWQAIAEAERLEAWIADEGFQAARAAGIEMTTKGGSRKPGPFELWTKHRYGWEQSRASQLSQAGRVYELTSSTTAVVEPESERQLRPLAKLLAKHQDSIPKVWEQAQREAEADRKPQSVARYVDRIIKAEFPELTKPARNSAEDDAALDRQLRQFRSLFRSLHGRMNRSDFADRVIGWINEEVGE